MAFDIITSATQTKFLADMFINKHKFDHFTIVEINLEAGCIIDTKKLEVCFKAATIYLNRDSNLIVVGQLASIDPYLIADYYLDGQTTKEGMERIVAELKQTRFSLTDWCYSKWLDIVVKARVELLEKNAPNDLM